MPPNPYDIKSTTFKLEKSEKNNLTKTHAKFQKETGQNCGRSCIHKIPSLYAFVEVEPKND